MNTLTKPTEAPIPITKATLLKWDRLEQKRLKLGRQASDLKKQIDEIEQELVKAIPSGDGVVRRLEAHGFVLAIESKKGSVSWKPEFIKVASQAAADKLIANAPLKDEFTITKL